MICLSCHLWLQTQTSVLIIIKKKNFKELLKTLLTGFKPNCWEYVSHLKTVAGVSVEEDNSLLTFYT